MKGGSKLVPPSSSPSESTSRVVHSVSNSSGSIVAYDVVATFSFNAFVPLAEAFSFGFSLSFIEASFYCVTFSFTTAFYFVKAFCASFFLSFVAAVVTVVFSASPLTSLLVPTLASNGVSYSLDHLLTTPIISSLMTKYANLCHVPMVSFFARIDRL